MEKSVLDYLHATVFPDAYRPRAGTHEDVGDYAGTDEWVFQVKNHAKLQLGVWIKEALEQAGRKLTARYAVIHKRKGVSAAMYQYCTMPLHVLIELIKENKDLKEENRILKEQYFNG